MTVPLLTLTISVTVPNALRRPRREMRKSLRQTFAFVGRFWHQRFRPIHFREVATRRYGYRPRQGETRSGAPDRGRRRFQSTYTGQKLRKFGHTLPLVWSGASRTLAGVVKITAKYNQVRVSMPVRGLNRRPRELKTSGALTGAQELKLITPGEMRSFEKNAGPFLERRLQKRLNR